MEAGSNTLLGPLGQLSRKTESSSKLPKEQEHRCTPMFPVLVTTRQNRRAECVCERETERMKLKAERRHRCEFGESVGNLP